MNRRWIILYATVVFILVALFQLPINARAYTFYNGVRVMRVGESCLINDTNYMDCTTWSKYWYYGNGESTSVSYYVNPDMRNLCTITAKKPGKCKVVCKTNGQLVHQLYVYANGWRTYTYNYSRAVEYDIAVEEPVKVYFDATGGTASKSYMTGGSYIGFVGDTMPTASRTDYTFLGWYTQKTGGEKVDINTCPKKNTTVYAHWKKEKLYINLDANGGSAKKNLITVKNGNEIGSLPEATRKNYLFQGWFTSKLGGVKVDSKTVFDSDQKIYARWKKIDVNKPSIKSIKSGYCTIVVNVGAAKDVEGYELQYSTNSNMSDAQSKILTSLEYTNKNLQRGYTYYVRVRAYKKDSLNQKVYSDYSSVKSVKVAQYLLSDTKLTLIKGESQKLILQGSSGKLKYSTSNKKVAKVSGTGLISAKKKGNVTITIKYKGKKYKCKVKVEEPIINKSSAKLLVGQTDTFKVTNTSKNVIYKSSNEKVAQIDKNGNIIAVGQGSATITANVSKKKYTCSVVVEGPKPSEESFILIKGKTKTISLNNTSYTVTYSSSNTNVARVDNLGKVTAVNAGTAKITMVANGKTYVSTVKVENPSKNVSDPSITVGTDISLNLKGTTLPVSYKSSNNQVATVSTTGVVKGIAVGTAKVTATVGGASYIWNVNVEEPYLAEEDICVQVGQSDLAYLCETSRTPIWTSSDDSGVVVVDGQITGKKIGKYQVIATLNQVDYVVNVKVVGNLGDISNPVDAKTGCQYSAGNESAKVVLIRKAFTSDNKVKLSFTLENTSGIEDITARKVLDLNNNFYDSDGNVLECTVLDNTTLDEVAYKTSDNDVHTIQFYVELEFDQIPEDGCIVFHMANDTCDTGKKYYIAK